MCAVDSMRKMYILKMIYYAVDDLYDLLWVKCNITADHM